MLSTQSDARLTVVNSNCPPCSCLSLFVTVSIDVIDVITLQWCELGMSLTTHIYKDIDPHGCELFFCQYLFS